MTAVIEMKPGALAGVHGTHDRMAVAEVLSHVVTVQEVMRSVMKPNVHYGKVPGTDKPTLLKPGAETLCMTFRIADTYTVEDLSSTDAIRYRVTCSGIHQTTGTVLGSGMGEASSNEEKYKWRKAVCKEEFEATPPHLRRSKYAKAKGGGFYVQDQVRTEPADLANTVLKMANKRAKIAMTLNVTAASDMFSQDLEDMSEELREHLAGQGEEPQPDQPPPPPVWPADVFEKKLPSLLKALEAGKPLADVIAWCETKGQLTEAQKARLTPPPAPAAAPSPSPAPAPTEPDDDLPY